MSEVETTAAAPKAAPVAKIDAAAEKAYAEAAAKVVEAPKAEKAPVVKKVAAPKKPVAAKYRNPNDASQTWSGRGRQPVWLVALLAEGKKLEDLAV